MRLSAAYPAAVSAIALTIPPCTKPCCWDVLGDGRSAISTEPGEIGPMIAPTAVICPCFAKLERMRDSAS